MRALESPTVTDAWLTREAAAVAPVVPRYFDLVAASARGCWITDVEGRGYLDFGAGIAVANVGHGHPAVVSAIQRQAASLLHTSVVFRHERYIELAEAIGNLCPFYGDPQVFLCNSGAEAVDASLKLARLATGRPGIVAFRRAFHGRTLAATSLTTAKARFRAGYEPLLPSVYHAPYCIPFEHGGDEERAVEAALAELDALLAEVAPPSNLGAMIVEPVLGEGGYVPPPRAWLEGLRRRCDDHALLLIFDEVQCGMGRTGRPFAAETYGIRPDVTLFAKGVASGLPLGGLVAEREALAVWPEGAHGSTFGGNPVACAAALATIAVLEGERLYDRAAMLGRRALDVLRTAAAAAPEGRVLDVRGLGLMIGVQLADGEVAAAVQARCLGDGLVVLTCGPGDDTLRLAPPLVITDDEFELGLRTLTEALLSV